jgi:NCS1 family nucleobase:cation symporter-1
LSLADLYLTTGRYGTWNWAGVAATILGCALAWGGLLVAPLRPLYDYAWFVGFAVSGVAYVVLARSARSGS